MIKNELTQILPTCSCYWIWGKSIGNSKISMSKTSTKKTTENSYTRFILGNRPYKEFEADSPRYISGRVPPDTPWYISGRVPSGHSIKISGRDPSGHTIIYQWECSLEGGHPINHISVDDFPPGTLSKISERDLSGHTIIYQWVCSIEGGHPVNHISVEEFSPGTLSTRQIWGIW